jgi:hypothetical protein
VPYIGQDLQVAFPSYTNIDDISGSFDGVTTSFPLTVSGVAPVPAPLGSNQCLISVDGVVQRPDDTGTEGFRLSGGNIIFSSAPSIADDFFGIILAGADYVNVGANFPDGTLGAPSITFDQDNDTGYYRSGSGAVSFASNGVAAGTWSSAGVTAPALIPTGSSVPANGVYLPAANTVGVATNGVERVEFGTGEVVFNDGGANYDFRIEGDTNANLFFVDASAEAVGIGTTSPDIKALQVRKYNFKEETGQETHTQIGLVAQEVELVSPGLVSESPDRDEDGNDLGTVTKSVNYSVLYMKAVKALQEAIAKIETLEGMVAVNNITIDEQQHQLSTLAARLTALESA